MFLLTAPILKKQSYFDWNLLYLSKRRPWPSLKVFRYQIWTSVKGSVKLAASKTEFSTFLQLSCSNFQLKLCEKSLGCQNYPGNWVWGGLARVGGGGLFLGAIMERIYETFSCEIHPNFLRSSSLKSFGNSYIPCLLLIITLRFTCGEKNIW